MMGISFFPQKLASCCSRCFFFLWFHCAYCLCALLYSHNVLLYRVVKPIMTITPSLGPVSPIQLLSLLYFEASGTEWNYDEFYNGSGVYVYRISLPSYMWSIHITFVVYVNVNVEFQTVSRTDIVRTCGRSYRIYHITSARQTVRCLQLDTMGIHQKESPNQVSGRAKWWEDIKPSSNNWNHGVVSTCRGRMTTNSHLAISLPL